ncbi:non-ribosomal peptide synthetase [Streptomyces sp. NBC_00829]|uniref:non-ribosomal peptide synthetase n=1 Tax=Streptomyces sp. NBC_00829 TaxID=2903679 RepID=UPI003867B6CC|nr:non-ribosomal peptide synthetase [Streptomyces sp. NBC_00829]
MHHSITAQYVARYRRIAADDAGAGLLPVTGAQRRFVLVRFMDPDGRPDIVPVFFAFPRGTVDPVRLRAAANHLAARHPVLRARPEVVRGTPVLRPAEPDVPVERVVRAPGEDSAGALRRALGDWRPEGSPLRLYLADGGDDCAEEVLAVVLDHAACDGRSLTRIVDELTGAYREGSAPHEVAPADAAAELASYREAVLLQLDAEQRAGSPAALAYWGDRLRALREHAPPPRSRHHGAAALPTGAAELRLPSPADGVPFPALLDACRATAGVLYGTGRVSPIGYPWGGRPPAAAPVLGCFLNTVVFPARTDDTLNGPSGDPQATTTDWWDDLDRADTPFDEVVHAARSAGAEWTGRLDGLLTVNDARHHPPLELGGVAGREVHIEGRRVRAPFAVSVTHASELHLRMVWDRSVLDDAPAERGFDAFRRALSHALSASMTSNATVG